MSTAKSGGVGGRGGGAGAGCDFTVPDEVHKVGHMAVQNGVLNVQQPFVDDHRLSTPCFCIVCLNDVVNLFECCYACLEMVFVAAAQTKA